MIEINNISLHIETQNSQCIIFCYAKVYLDLISILLHIYITNYKL